MQLRKSTNKHYFSVAIYQQYLWFLSGKRSAFKTTMWKGRKWFIVLALLSLLFWMNLQTSSNLFCNLNLYQIMINCDKKSIELCIEMQGKFFLYRKSIYQVLYLEYAYSHLYQFLLWLQMFILKNHFLNDVNRILWIKCPWMMIHKQNFVQQTKFAINHTLRLWVCFVVGITTILMLYLISRARKFLALFASFSLLVISFVVVFSRKRRDGPNTAQHTTTLPRGGDLEKITQKLP